MIQTRDELSTTEVWKTAISILLDDKLLSILEKYGTDLFVACDGLRWDTCHW